MTPTHKRIPTEKAMTVAGIMSGTSADGIDVALVRIAPGVHGPRIKLLAHHAVPFSKQLRAAVLASMDAKSISTAELARLNWHLGIAYADAVRQTLKNHPVKIDLIGCHGQTIYHQPTPALHAGKKLNCTWQIGEMAITGGRGRSPRHLELPPSGHGCWRPRRAACSVARFRYVQPSGTRARAAEPRRHRQPDSDSAWSIADRHHRLRYRPRQHGDRCDDDEALQPSV